MIQFNDEYYIEVESSPICYTLRRKQVSKPKDGSEPKIRYVCLGYFSTVEGVLRGLHEQIVTDRLEGGLFSLDSALAVIVETRKEVVGKINELLDGLGVVPRGNKLT